MVATVKSEQIVGVLWGGLSAERDISRLTGEAVCAALETRGHQVCSIPVEPDGAWLTRVQKTDVVFVALHGKFGEDGAVQGVLETLGLPYTGSNLLASALAMNKPMAKRVWQTYDLRTPQWEIIEQGAPCALTRLSYPVVVKPVAEGSSVGVNIVHSEDMLAFALDQAFRYDATCLVETYIPGQEVTVGIVEEEAIGAMEVVAQGEFHSYEVKYTPGREEFLMPAPLPEATYKRVLKVAQQAHTALGCTGYSRVDTRVNPSGEIFLIELNSLPGLMALSYLPRIAAYNGLTYEDLVEAILRQATLHNPRQDGKDEKEGRVERDGSFA